MEEPTIIELLDHAGNRIGLARISTADRAAAAREFAIALTELENTRMRVNRGMALKYGRYNPVDVEKQERG